MSVTVACLSCGAKLRAPDNVIGRTFKCPKCSKPVTVGAVSASQAEHRPASTRIAEGYYLKDHQGIVRGPFSSSNLKRLASEKKLDLSWQISVDQVSWCPVAKVRNLSTDLEKLLVENLATEGEYRNLRRQEVIALFIDKFILNNDNFKGALPFLQPIRVWWAKLTLPSNFVITEVTAAGIHHVKYNVGTGESHEIEQSEAEKNVSEGVKQFNWFLLLAAVLGVVWLVWTLKDFVSGFSLTWGTVKTLLLAGIALAGFIWKTKQSKVFVGYKLDATAMMRLEEIAAALRILRKCGKVWSYRVREHEGRLNWKYNAGDTFKVTRLPLAIFNRTIPNVETNIRVNGITCGSQALYFLPDKILVIDGSEVKNVRYAELQIAVDSLEYVETEGQVYEDSDVIDHRWKFINRDGSRDKRFNNNVELPVVRCGILVLRINGAQLKMMTTNRDAPAEFQEKFGRLTSTEALPKELSPDLETDHILEAIPVLESIPPLRVDTVASKQRLEGNQSSLLRPRNDLTTELERLAGLLEKGLITRREFDEMKRNLLNQIH